MRLGANNNNYQFMQVAEISEKPVFFNKIVANLALGAETRFLVADRQQL